MRKIYLDYAASTPVAPEVEAAMRPYFLNEFGNAGSLHSFGQEAIKALDESREVIANSINANFREVIFTGSATEANNLALRGSIRGLTRTAPLDAARGKRGLTQKNFRDGQRKASESQRLRIIVSAIEHESVLETARDLEKEGVEVIYLPVSKAGIVDLKKLKESLNDRTILVSVMYANNEIGTIQPIAKISQIIGDFRQKLEMRNEKLGDSKSSSLISHLSYPIFHTDAVQAFQFLDCDVQKLGADLMTISAHKIYGPKGVGALYARTIDNKQLTIDKKDNSQMSNVKGQRLSPVTTGGGQEFGLRSGTENIPLIVGFAKAVELISNSRELENNRISKLRDYFWNGIRKIYSKARTNPDSTQTYTEKLQYKSAPALSRIEGLSQPKSATLPNFLNVYFPDYKAEDLLTRFDLAGLAVSAGSACSARSPEPSYVIKALGLKKKRLGRNIRFSLGRPTAKKDIDTALKIIKNATAT